MLVSILFLALTIVEPWVLVSVVTRQECHDGQCHPMARQPVPQERQVQIFPTVEDCLKTREAMQRHALEAVDPINQLVHERSPQWYIRLSTTFVCKPTSGTTAEELQ
jgi:hypothetical protein